LEAPDFGGVGASGGVRDGRGLEDYARGGELRSEETHRGEAGAEVVEHAQAIGSDEKDGVGGEVANEVEVGERVGQRGEETARGFDEEDVGRVRGDPAGDEVEVDGGAGAPGGEVRGDRVSEGVGRRGGGSGAHASQARGVGEGEVDAGLDWLEAKRDPTASDECRDERDRCVGLSDLGARSRDDQAMLGRRHGRELTAPAARCGGAGRNRPELG
jgi:hypothetical protein